MNRILIFGLPRTGTTILEEYLKTKYNSPKLTEPYGRDEIRKNYIDFTKELKSNTVVKLLTPSCCCHFPVNVPQLIGLNIFDKIVVTRRADLVDTCLSLYYADYVVRQFQWEQNHDVKEISFECDKSFAENFRQEIEFFEKTLAWFDRVNLQYDVFDYDKFLASKEQKVFDFVIAKDKIHSKFKKSGIDYKTLCTNYETIAQTIGGQI